MGGNEARSCTGRKEGGKEEGNRKKEVKGERNEERATKKGSSKYRRAFALFKRLYENSIITPFDLLCHPRFRSNSTFYLHTMGGVYLYEKAQGASRNFKNSPINRQNFRYSDSH